MRAGELPNDIDTVSDEFGWRLSSGQLAKIRTSPWLKSIVGDPKLREAVMRVDAAADREKELAKARQVRPVWWGGVWWGGVWLG